MKFKYTALSCGNYFQAPQIARIHFTAKRRCNNSIHLAVLLEAQPCARWSFSQQPPEQQQSQ
jgi:hypothetical protein